MRFNDDFKHPRVFVDAPLSDGGRAALSQDQAHYLKNVMRKNDGDTLRIFNGRDGEFLSTLRLEGKKLAFAQNLRGFKHQPETEPQIHLLFAPIKKAQMGFLIEKAVELGVTDLTPVITARTENRKWNAEKSRAHVIEAAEQCERLTLPRLHDAQKLMAAFKNWDQTQTIHWCAERMEGTKKLKDCAAANTFLIGPEGGFDEAESQYLQSLRFITPIDLGEQILRAETAALYCLAHAKLQNV